MPRREFLVKMSSTAEGLICKKLFLLESRYKGPNQGALWDLTQAFMHMCLFKEEEENIQTINFVMFAS